MIPRAEAVRRGPDRPRGGPDRHPGGGIAGVQAHALHERRADRLRQVTADHPAVQAVDAEINRVQDKIAQLNQQMVAVAAGRPGAAVSDGPGEAAGTDRAL